MKSIRWKIALILLWLSILFNIERLDFDQGANINLASSFYAITAITALLFLFVPMRPYLAYAAGSSIFIVYILLKYLSPVPIFHSYHKYLTITEIGTLLVTMVFMWILNQALYDFEQAVESISLPKGRSGLLDNDQMQDRIQSELSRARRHQHPVSVAVIELDPVSSQEMLHRAVREAQAALIKRYVLVRFGVFMSKHIRDTDVIAYKEAQEQFVLLAPQTSGELVESMLQRLIAQSVSELGIQFQYKIADFPKTALTSEELIHKATEQLHGAKKLMIPDAAVGKNTADTESIAPWR